MVQILVSDETGLVKLVNVKTKEVVAKCGQQSRTASVAKTAWIPVSSKASEDDHLSSTKFASLTTAGAIEVWDTSAQKRLHMCPNAGANTVLLACWQGNFVTCNRKGELRVVPQSSTDAQKDSKLQVDVGTNVNAAQLHQSSGLVAVGGEEHDLSLWDLATGKQAWRARNVTNDNLDMRVPVWIKTLTFLPSVCGSAEHHADDAAASAAGSSTACKQVIATATHYKQIRIYDTRAGRRPIREAMIGEFPFTCMCSSPDGKHLFLGDTSGMIRRVETATLKETGVYKGGAGAIRGLQVHPDPSVPYLAAVGLDRTLRVYNVDTKQLVRRVHLKQRLTSVAFVPTQPKAKKSEAAEVADIEPEGAVPGAGSGTRILAWREYADREKARRAAAAAAAAEAEGKGAGKDGKGKDKRKAAAKDEEENDESVWLELERRTAAAKRQRQDEAEVEDDEDEDEDDDEEDDEEDDDEGIEEDSDDEGIDDEALDGEDDDDDEDDEDDEDDDEDLEEEAPAPPPRSGPSKPKVAPPPAAKKPRK